MKKILVPVDFSANSKKAIRFAIQFAAQSKSEIIFFHVVNIPEPPGDAIIGYAYVAGFEKNEIEHCQAYLDRLIKKVYSDLLPKGVKFTCVCQLGNNVPHEIIDYATKIKASFICTGARGNSIMARWFGTVATHLIVHSPIPVFVIPKNYRHKPLTGICYASDMPQIRHSSFSNTLKMTAVSQCIICLNPNVSK